MKKTAFSLLLLVATIALAHAGGFGGPPPFTNGSPLISGVDGSYQASARGKNLAGVFRFAYSGGIQITSPTITLGNLLIDPYNDYVFFVEGVSYRGLVQANINISKIFGILDNGGANVVNGPQDFIVVTAPDGTVTVVNVEDGSLGSIMSGFFEGSMDHNSPYAYFSGKGQVVVSNGSTSNSSSTTDATGTTSTDTTATSGPNSSSGSATSTVGPNTTNNTTNTSGSSTSTTGTNTTTDTTTTSATTSTTGPIPTSTTTTTSTSSTSGPSNTTSGGTSTTSTNSTSGPNTTTSNGTSGDSSVTSSSNTTTTSNNSSSNSSTTTTVDRVFSLTRDFKFSGVRNSLGAPSGGTTTATGG